MVRYTYDGLMKRAFVDNASSPDVVNFFSQSGTLGGLSRSGADNVHVDYIRANGALVAAVEREGSGSDTRWTPTYRHDDHLGSTQVATDRAGLVVFQEYYTPYGEVENASSLNNDRAGYTGHIRDAATGLTYMQARYYSPHAGRMLSVDPVDFASIGDPRYINRYAYAGNDPVNATDPDGRQKRSLLKETARDIRRAVKNARARGRRAALRRERQQLRETGQSVSNLSPERSSELLETGNLRGMDAHHDPSINNGATTQEKIDIAQNPENITFMEPSNHRQVHQDNGGTNVPIDSKNKLGVAVAGVGLTVMEGVANILDAAAGVPDPMSISFEAGQILGSDCVQCEVESRLDVSD